MERSRRKMNDNNQEMFQLEREAENLMSTYFRQLTKDSNGNRVVHKTTVEEQEEIRNRLDQIRKQCQEKNYDIANRIVTFLQQHTKQDPSKTSQPDPIMVMRTLMASYEKTAPSLRDKLRKTIEITYDQVRLEPSQLAELEKEYQQFLNRYHRDKLQEKIDAYQTSSDLDKTARIEEMTNYYNQIENPTTEMTQSYLEILNIEKQRLLQKQNKIQNITAQLDPERSKIQEKQQRMQEMLTQIKNLPPYPQSTIDDVRAIVNKMADEIQFDGWKAEDFVDYLQEAKLLLKDKELEEIDFRYAKSKQKQEEKTVHQVTYKSPLRKLQENISKRKTQIVALFHKITKKEQKPYEFDNELIRDIMDSFNKKETNQSQMTPISATQKQQEMKQPSVPKINVPTISIQSLPFYDMRWIEGSYEFAPNLSAWTSQDIERYQESLMPYENAKLARVYTYENGTRVDRLAYIDPAKVHRYQDVTNHKVVEEEAHHVR